MADARYYGSDGLMAGKQVGTGIHRNYKMANYIAYQRRQLSPQAFDRWLYGDDDSFGNVAAQCYLERQDELTKGERELERIFNEIGRKCILPSLQMASDFLAALEKASAAADSATGTLAQSIGSTKAKLYGSFCGWVGSGPRRGYARAVEIQVTTQGKIKLKRLSKKQTLIRTATAKKNPVQYAYYLIHGHKGVEPSKKKALLIASTGFVGLRRRTKDAPPKNFMAPAEAAADRAAAIATAGIDQRLQAQLTQ